MSGGHSGEAIPVPIPNTEVKLSNADDTALYARESRQLPGFFFNFGGRPESSGRRFFCPRRGLAAFLRTRGRGLRRAGAVADVRTQGGGRNVRMRFFLRGDTGVRDGLVFPDFFFRPETERQRAAQWTVLQDVLACGLSIFFWFFFLRPFLNSVKIKC